MVNWLFGALPTGVGRCRGRPTKLETDLAVLVRTHVSFVHVYSILTAEAGGGGERSGRRKCPMSHLGAVIRTQSQTQQDSQVN